MFLADKLIERSRPHPRRKRRCFINCRKIDLFLLEQVLHAGNYVGGRLGAILPHLNRNLTGQTSYYLTPAVFPHVNIPRQPCVGLALIAAIGIVVADFFPISASHWWLELLAFALFAIPLCCWPNLKSTYLLVGAGFVLLHNFRTGDSAGLRLAADLNDRPRVVNAIGFVTSEPKVATNGFATFLFQLESIEFEGKIRPTDATLLARWRGNPEFGDKLKLFGIAEPVESPRNPGEFDMRSYLA